MKLDVDSSVLADKTDVVILCVGELQFFSPRAVLVFHSTFLKEQLDVESAMFFPEFKDVPHIFELALDLLKGVEVEVTAEVIRGLLKFAVMCKTEMLFNELLEWLKTEFKEQRVEFLTVFQISQFIQKFDIQRTQIIEFCKNQLENKGLFIIDREFAFVPENAVDNAFLELLVDTRYIWLTLSFLQRLVTDQARAEFVLGLISNCEIIYTLRTCKLFIQNFLSHLRSLLVNSETKHLLILIKIQEKLLKTITPNRYRLMPMLSNEDYIGAPEKRAQFLALTPEKLSRLKQRLNLKDVVYCELVVDWLKARTNDPSKKALFIQKIWESINFKKLSRGFVFDMKETLQKFCSREKLVLELPSKDHSYLGFGFYLSEHETYALRVGHPVLLEHHCTICECEESSPQGLCLQLTDNTPCYTVEPARYSSTCHHHTLSPHWWLSYDGSEIISFITNTRDKITEILSSTVRVYVCCMVSMIDNPILNVQLHQGS